MASDTYFTVKYPSSGIYKEKGSRFISHAFPVKDPEEIREIIYRIRKQHHGARHNCYAYVLGPERAKWRSSDDGEPSGSAGKPILGQINARNLTDILIIVTRYFGGTLLGISGLTKAYKKAADDAIANNKIIEVTVEKSLLITFPYISMNDVMKVIKEEGITHSGQEAGSDICSMKISIRTSITEDVIYRLSRIEGLSFRYPV